MENEEMSKADLIAMLVSIREVARTNGEIHTVEHIDKIQEGGEVFSFASIDEAAGYFSMFGHELPTDVALDGILNDTNCDWIVFDDGSVIFKYYGRGYDESVINEMIEKECRI